MDSANLPIMDFDMREHDYVPAFVEGAGEKTCAKCNSLFTGGEMDVCRVCWHKAEGRERRDDELLVITRKEYLGLISLLKQKTKTKTKINHETLP